MGPAPHSWAVARFPSPEALLGAVRKLRAEGQREVDTHTPFPIRGMSAALGLPRSTVPAMALTGGMLGLLLAYGVMYFMSAVQFPLNVGNRLPHPPPSFVPITFEVGVLLSALSIFFGLMLTLGLPRLHHPLFDWDAFLTASTHGYWISVRTPPGGAGSVEEELRTLGGADVGTLEGEA